jgi:hypothetical protein
MCTSASYALKYAFGVIGVGVGLGVGNCTKLKV